MAARLAARSQWHCIDINTRIPQEGASFLWIQGHPNALSGTQTSGFIHDPMATYPAWLTHTHTCSFVAITISFWCYNLHVCVWGGGRILSAGVGVRHRKNPINGSWGRSGGWGLSLIFRVSGVFHWSLLEIRHAPPPRQHNTLQSGVGFHLFYHLLYIYICVCVSVCVCACVCVCGRTLTGVERFKR